MIKSNMKAFMEYQRQVPEAQRLKEHFLPVTGYWCSTLCLIFQKMQEIAQEHYTELCRHYVPKQNIDFDESLINHEEEKLRSLYKYEKKSTNTLCL